MQNKSDLESDVCLYKVIDSPVGSLTLACKNDALIAILWDNESGQRVKLGEMVEDTQNLFLIEVEKQLNEYFNKKRQIFNLPIQVNGTPFQKDVWKYLLEIPFGQTRTYKQIAEKINPRAIRAVGTAIGRNPISILIPCHRVIGSNGSLTGFAGGLDRKKLLLDLELY